MHATSFIWQAAECPEMSGFSSGLCRACGQDGSGLPFEDWVRDTFMDFDKLSPGLIICHACQFCFAENNEALTKRTSKDKPQRMRNYSHFVLNNEWIPLSKGDKRRMREILLAGPQLAVIAESGQKHIIFRAQAGWWQLEEQRMMPCPGLLTDLLGPIEALYNAGANKSEIETGRYFQKTLMKILPLWREHEPFIKEHRGGLPLKLAVFLAQKEKEDDTRTASD